jgi:hypothetical protein
VSTPNWNDIYTADELAAALHVYSARLAREKGWYDIANDIRLAAECIRDLDDKNQELLGLSRSLSKLSQTLAAGVESLSKVP